jgi:hypothetical protein
MTITEMWHHKFTRAEIIATWEKYGTGVPLPDERVDALVEWLNQPPGPIPVPYFIRPTGTAGHDAER